MSQSINKWSMLRIIICIISALTSKSSMEALLSDDVNRDFLSPSLSFPFIMAGLTAFAVIFTLGLQKMRSNTLDWGAPSWSSNPFNINTPIQFFHMGAWSFISLGIGHLILGITDNPVNWAWELTLSAGIGLLLGVHLMAEKTQNE